MYVRRINVNQAALIYASSVPLWDYESFLEHREMWRAVRALSGVNSTELTARFDISPASISRHEKKTRNPPVLLMRDIHNAYVELLEIALLRAEWCLIIDSWADAVVAETGIPYDGLADTIDDVHAWVAQGTDLKDFAIEHNEHLATVRRWMPYPDWRTATVDNLWLSGFPAGPALIPA